MLGAWSKCRVSKKTVCLGGAYRVGRSLSQYHNAGPTFQTQFQTRPQQRKQTHVKRVCKENSKITLGTKTNTNRMSMVITL
jgi:hypothetical protein